MYFKNVEGVPVLGEIGGIVVLFVGLFLAKTKKLVRFLNGFKIAMFRENGECAVT